MRKTAKLIGVELRGELKPCRGCSKAKGLRRSIPRLTRTRAAKPASRVLVDLTGRRELDLGEGSGTWYFVI
ncbi:unnamed protein product, partial [Sphacelaria rigidula]